MSIFGKAAHFMGKAKGSSGFGFKDKVQQAGQKMYGYGSSDLGKSIIAGTALTGGLAYGLNKAGVSFDPYGEKSFGSQDLAKQEEALIIAFQREIEGNLSRDHHLDNLKVIRSFALNNPNHFNKFLNNVRNSDQGQAFVNKLRNSYAEYKDNDMVNLIGK